MVSLIHYRPLTFATHVSSSFSTRLVPYPPDLIKWVKREGGFVHKSIQLSDKSNGVGLVASESIPKGCPLITLPDHVPLKFGSVADQDVLDGPTSVLVDLAQKIPDELWAMKLGLKLLHERAKVGSFWWPYISNLPEAFNLPIFFPEEDVKNLQYPPLIYQVNKRCLFMLDFEKIITRKLDNLEAKDHPFGGQAVDASAIAWAMSAVSSRSFRLYGEKLADGTRAGAPMLLPLIDMCNHSFNPNARIVQEQDANTASMLVKVIAESDIKKNESLLLNYGCLSNDLLLLDYGFVIPSNPYDMVDLKYDETLLEAASNEVGVFTPCFSSPRLWQKQILSRLHLDGDDSSLKVTLGGEEVVDGRLLAAIRILLTNDEEAVAKLDLETLKSLSSDAPLGVSNELAALHTVVGLCGILHRCFPSKEIDDKSILESDAVSASTKLAVQYRFQKKRVISEVMKHLSNKLKPLIMQVTARS